MGGCIFTDAVMHDEPTISPEVLLLWPLRVESVHSFPNTKPIALLG